MADYEERECRDCMYFEKDACEEPNNGPRHKACRWFKERWYTT